MQQLREAFLSLPDAVIITDRDLIVLDFNRKADFRGLRAGVKLTEVFPDLHGEGEQRITLGDRFYQRRVTAIREGDVLMGYTVHLTDTTELQHLLQQSRRESLELKKAVSRQRSANEELERYARQAEQLADYGEQLRIARDIHDNAGHAITEIHSIAQMCLRLMDTDRVEYDRLLEEGIAICDRALHARERSSCSSVAELLENFKAGSPFPIEIAVEGQEPDFVSGLYEVIYAVVREAHHNTLSHSMAEKQRIIAEFREDRLTLSVLDDGSFHGLFEKGFGLTTLEERVEKTGGSIRYQAEEGKGFGLIAEWRASR